MCHRRAMTRSLPRAAACLLPLVVGALVGTAGPASATKLPGNTGLRDCHTVQLKHHVELEMCSSVEATPSGFLSAASDITAYKVSKKDGRVQTDAVQVSTSGASCTIYAPYPNTAGSCGGPSYPQGTSAGYQSSASRGGFQTTSGQAYQLQSQATFGLWENGVQT